MASTCTDRHVTFAQQGVVWRATSERLTPQCYQAMTPLEMGWVKNRVENPSRAKPGMTPWDRGHFGGPQQGWRRRFQESSLVMLSAVLTRVETHHLPEGSTAALKAVRAPPVTFGLLELNPCPLYLHLGKPSRVLCFSHKSTVLNETLLKAFVTLMQNFTRRGPTGGGPACIQLPFL